MLICRKRNQPTNQPTGYNDYDEGLLPVKGFLFVSMFVVYCGNVFVCVCVCDIQNLIDTKMFL